MMLRKQRYDGGSSLHPTVVSHLVADSDDESLFLIAFDHSLGLAGLLAVETYFLPCFPGLPDLVRSSRIGCDCDALILDGDRAVAEFSIKVSRNVIYLTFMLNSATARSPSRMRASQLQPILLLRTRSGRPGKQGRK